MSQAQKNLRGIVAMMLAMGLFVINDTLVKLARVHWDAGQIMAVRGFFGLALMAIWLRQSHALGKLNLVLRPPMLGRGALEAGIAATFITALGFMPLAEITAILMLAPLLITALSMIFFGEKVGWRRWSAVVVGFLGMLLVVRPGDGAFPLFALVLAFVSVLGVAARDITTRRLPLDVPTAVIALMSIIGTTLAGLILSLFGDGWRPITPQLAVIIGSAALFVAMGNYAIVAACRDAELSVVSPFRYVVIIWAVLLGILVFGDWPSPIALAGIALIGISGLYTLHRERIRQKTQ
ncbi:MAG TPA: DMT family transporter [Rhabdaerophilum sp.]|nr:DMT family transporter [Rhabdaerophilum sp.]